MQYVKRNWQVILEALFFIGIFLLSLVPLRDFDIWFHVKSGEIIAKMGIIHYDVFSYNTQGREWFPYEWLYQITVYFIQQTFSFEAIKYVTAVVVTLQIWVFYRILKKLLNLNILLSLFTVFFFYVSVFEYYNARPHVVAYTFLLINLYLILLYYFRKKNLLALTLPITLMWANMHGSIFLDVGLFVGYIFICLVHYFFSKSHDWIEKAKKLSFYGSVTAILTILPPLGILQYKLLWIFFQKRQIIARFVDEWTPLSTNPIGFWIYTCILSLILAYTILIIIKKRAWRQALWLIPLLPFVFLAYTASRNVFLGNISLTIILGWNLTFLKFKNYSKKVKTIIISLFIVALVANVWLLNQKDRKEKLYYPVKATQFIKKFNLRGNMFNEYGYGGFLLYELYPEHKVFFDGRTDVYLCCEIPDSLDVAINKYFPDDKYQKYLYTKIWDKYKISYVLIRTEKHTLLRKIARVLSQDSQWALVYWDDYTQIFVRKDGKNNDIIKKFGAIYATPYLRNPFEKDKLEQAYLEYLRMDKVAKSARTSNAIGYILLTKNSIGEAQNRFNEATKLDPSFESPYMNLAEIAAKNGDYHTAIDLYKKAQTLADDRGLIYIRLGQLYIEGFHDLEKAKKIWSLGLKPTVDQDAKKTLINLLKEN